MRTFAEAAEWVERTKKMPVKNWIVGRLEAKATVQSIADELKVDRSTLYYHFRTLGITLQRTVVVANGD